MGGAVLGRLWDSFFWFGAVDWALNIAPPTGLKRKLHLTAGLHPRLLTCRPYGNCFWGVDFCGFASGLTGLSRWAGWVGFSDALSVRRIFVVWRYLRRLNVNAWFIAGLYLRLLPWCLPTGALRGTGPVGLVCVGNIYLLIFADYEGVMSIFCRELLVFCWGGIDGFVGGNVGVIVGGFMDAHYAPISFWAKLL